MIDVTLYKYSYQQRIGESIFEKESNNYSPLPKSKVVSQSSQIQKPTLHSQEPQIPSSQRMIHSTSMEGKQIIQPLNHRSRIQSRSDLRSRERSH